jgi:hypothetical protein
MMLKRENPGKLPAVAPDNEATAVKAAVEIMQKATKKSLNPSQREGLAGRIKGAVLAYHGIQFMAEQAGESTLHEIAAPIDEAIEILEHPANSDEVLTALGAHPMLMVSPDRESVDRAIDEYQTVLRGLHKIRDKLPPPPSPKKPGRPKAHDLHGLVERLADVWKTFTGQEFTQLWHKGEPVSASAQFVYEVIKVVDPKRLMSVPDVTEQIVKDRRKPTSEK